MPEHMFKPFENRVRYRNKEEEARPKGKNLKTSPL
jgi:hypothetical protein